jgi:aspartyl-tRNA(Asn)/glutamyl-tRNA(Gln) amidotransferase subunit A
MNELADLSAIDQLRKFANGTLSPVEVTKAVIGRIEALNPAFNAFCHLREDQALAAARASEQRWQSDAPKGTLDGVIVSVKDNLPARGMPTRYGSMTTEVSASTDDAASVAQMRAAGAIIIGKTTTPEMGNKIVTDSPLTGVTRNPWNPDFSPGGSSGGAAVAVATGMGPIAIGSDGGGSIRVPSGWTGVFGLKPTYGRVPAYPAGWYGTMHHVGPLTRTVEDAALAMNVMTRPDPRAWSALPTDGRNYLAGIDSGIRGMRIAYSRTLGVADTSVDPEISSSVEQAVGKLVQLGAVVEESDPPRMAEVLKCLGTHWVVSTLSGLESVAPQLRPLLDPRIHQLAEVARKLSSSDYMNAIHNRIELGREMDLWFENYDILVLPTFHVGAPLVGTFPETILGPPRLTGPFNATKNPAASIPCGFTAAGMPIGLQVVGHNNADHVVLRACRAFEAIRGRFPAPLDRLKAK